MPTTRSGKSSVPLSTQSTKPRPRKKAKIDRNPKTAHRDSPSTNHTTSSLPNEIIHHIISFSASFNHQKTISSCCQVSKNFYNIASPILWNHLKLRPLQTDESNSELADEEEKYVFRAESPKYEVNRNEVKTFSIYPHVPGWCFSETHTTLSLPKLHTLHIHLNQSLCLHDRPHGNLSCRLLRSLNPKILVIHTGCMTHLGLNLDCLPKKIFQEAEVIIFLSPALSATCTRSMEYRRLPFMPKLNKVIWISHPIINPECRTLSDTPTSDFSTYPTEFIVTFARTFKYTPITIVNIGMIGPNDSNLTENMVNENEKQKESSVREILKEEMIETGSSPGIVKERLDSIRFIRMKDFVEEEDWWRYLDEQELNNWVEFMDVNDTSEHDENEGE